MSARELARHHGSFMFLAWTSTTAGIAQRSRVTRTLRSMVARPFVGTRSLAGRTSPCSSSTTTTPREPDRVVPTEHAEQLVELVVAEAAIGQDRDSHSIGQ